MLEQQSPASPAGICNYQVRYISPGLGTVCNGIRTGGPWSQSEQQLHINCLELLAATLAVKSFLKDQEGSSVLLQLDNQTAVAYINNMGGTVSLQLTDLAKALRLRALNFHGHCPVCRTYPGTMNCIADIRVQNFERSNRLEATPSDI